MQAWKFLATVVAVFALAGRPARSISFPNIVNPWSWYYWSSSAAAVAAAPSSAITAAGATATNKPAVIVQSRQQEQSANIYKYLQNIQSILSKNDSRYSTPSKIQIVSHPRNNPIPVTTTRMPEYVHSSSSVEPLDVTTETVTETAVPSQRTEPVTEAEAFTEPLVTEATFTDPAKPSTGTTDVPIMFRLDETTARIFREHPTTTTTTVWPEVETTTTVPAATVMTYVVDPRVRHGNRIEGSITSSTANSDTTETPPETTTVAGTEMPTPETITWDMVEPRNLISSIDDDSKFVRNLHDTYYSKAGVFDDLMKRYLIEPRSHRAVARFQNHFLTVTLDEDQADHINRLLFP